MNPTQPSEDELQGVNNPLKVMQPGERVICEIKRHPFGLLSLYFIFVAVVVVAIAAVVVAPHILTGMTSQNQAALALGALIICAITGLFTYIGASVYKGNRWIVTSDSITQITQISLFNKQTSQLSMENLEDVTVEQNGMLQSMFGFGRLRAETAGERSKFVFDYCPRPSEFAKQIIAAHETYIAHSPEGMRRTNQAPADVSSFNPSYAQPQQQYAVQPGQPAPSYNGPIQQPAPQSPYAYDPTRPYAQPPQPGPQVASQNQDKQA
jgi:hypothetical protein